MARPSSSSSSLHDLPDDVLVLVSACIDYRDLLHLSFTCKKLHELCTSSNKLWMPHCRMAMLPSQPPQDLLPHWRSAVESAKALLRFLIAVKPLIGIWVHQNPELGNLVYVTWGFVSVVACRIIPQELGPQGFDSGLLWAPVFEILANRDGTLVFFLHGRERDRNFIYPGRLKASSRKPYVLLLEAEPLLKTIHLRESPSFDSTGEDSGGEDQVTIFCKGSMGKKKAVVAADPVPFHRLAFGDRRRLLEELAPQVRVPIPPQATSGPAFLSSQERKPSLATDDGFQRQIGLMSERRIAMLRTYANSTEPGSPYRGVDSATLVRSMCAAAESLDAIAKTSSTSDKPASTVQNRVNANCASPSSGPQSDGSLKKMGFARFLRSKLKQIVGKNGIQDSSRVNSPSASEMKRLQLQEFLKQEKAVGLRLQATSWRLSFYRAWPIMHDNRFALYKIPVQKQSEGREHAGLWGGTFGWPLGRPTQEKLGVPLFFLLLSYDENEEGLHLIATKILEGTHYVLHPNGSAMFTAKINEPSSEEFPFDMKSEGCALDIVKTSQGEGIANGYGFRYPGSKPGDLFEFHNGALAFVWRESQAVLSLQRMDLQSLLEKGEKVTALPPISNFAYLTKSYSNVFAGYCGPMATAERK